MSHPSKSVITSEASSLLAVAGFEGWHFDVWDVAWHEDLDVPDFTFWQVTVQREKGSPFEYICASHLSQAVTMAIKGESNGK